MKKNPKSEFNMKLHLTNALLWIQNSESNWISIHKMKGNIKKRKRTKKRIKMTKIPKCVHDDYKFMHTIPGD